MSDLKTLVEKQFVDLYVRLSNLPFGERTEKFGDQTVIDIFDNYSFKEIEKKISEKAEAFEPGDMIYHIGDGRAAMVTYVDPQSDYIHFMRKDGTVGQCHRPHIAWKKKGFACPRSLSELLFDIGQTEKMG